MSTTGTYYADAADNCVRTYDASVWATCVEGGQPIIRTATNTWAQIMCASDSGLYAEEMFVWFDTSDIPAGNVIESATLSLAFIDNYTTVHQFDINCYVGGAADIIATTDWIKASEMAGKTLVAKYTVTAGFNTWNTYYALTSQGSALADAIVKEGKTRLALVPSALTGGAPDDAHDAFIQIYPTNAGTTYRPKLVVVHSEPTGKPMSVLKHFYIPSLGGINGQL